LHICEIDFPEPLLDRQKDGGLAVFAGAGVSIPTPSSYPNFKDLANRVAGGVLTLEPNEPIGVDGRCSPAWRAGKGCGPQSICVAFKRFNDNHRRIGAIRGLQHMRNLVRLPRGNLEYFGSHKIARSKNR
jgi:hypothetical protein